jgi:Zn-dependent protease with chaperone function
MSQATARNGHPPALLSTHPPDAQRIAQLKALLPDAERIYREHETG